MNSRIHDTATKMGVRAFLPPFQGSRGGRCTQGSAFGSTLGYIPAAASRLKEFAIFPDVSVVRNTSSRVGRIGSVPVMALTAILGAALGCGERPAVRSVPVERRDLVQYLTTNGRVEPTEDYAISAPIAGRVRTTPVEKGGRVSQGAVVATIEDESARTDFDQAQARLRAAEARSAQADHGGPAAETADIKARLQASRRAEERARLKVASLERLVAGEAAPRIELDQARTALSEREADLAAGKKQWELRVDPEQRQLAAARVSEADAAARSAESRLRASAVRSPAEGVLYSLEVRPGDYVERGAVIARVGKLDAVRVVVFVDEPELGRVKQDARVVLEADAYPEQSWEGRIDRLPTRIVSLDTRRVGEVICTVENHEGFLIPNLTVSAQIESGAVKGALTVPREAVVEKDGQSYLWLHAEGETARKQAVELGLRTASLVEVRSGIGEGDRVLLSGGPPLQPGQKVRAEM